MILPLATNSTAGSRIFPIPFQAISLEFGCPFKVLHYREVKGAYSGAGQVCLARRSSWCVWTLNCSLFMSKWHPQIDSVGIGKGTHFSFMATMFLKSWRRERRCKWRRAIRTQFRFWASDNKCDILWSSNNLLLAVFKILGVLPWYQSKSDKLSDSQCRI